MLYFKRRGRNLNALAVICDLGSKCVFSYMNNSGTGYVFLVTDAELKNCDVLGNAGGTTFANSNLVALSEEAARRISAQSAQPPAPSKQFQLGLLARLL
jgi:hypothetical protein